MSDLGAMRLRESLPYLAETEHPTSDSLSAE